ncbi:MAG: hypothetical protein GXO87_10805 [Chlorobi bacterium]|nr:hypothetical protein [Chlorobiota bacterium]
MRRLTYKTFSKLFYYPDAEIADLLKKGVVSEFLSEMNLTDLQIEDFNGYLRKFNDVELLLEDLQVEYTGLFITAFPEVPAPVFGSFYFERELIGESTERIIEFYEKYDFHVSEEIGEPPDHFAVELEFVFRMIESEIPLEIQALFIKEKILSWAEKFAEKIRASAKTPFYPFLINTTINYLKEDLRQIEIKKSGVEL